jgi:hypothetical protein
VTYDIHTRGTCSSSNVIYLITCNHCLAFYVGLTSTQLNIRLNNHRSSVSQHLQLPVAEHAHSHDLPFNECFKVQIIRVLPPETPPMELRHWELSYISILKSTSPPGLNLR